MKTVAEIVADVGRLWGVLLKKAIAYVTALLLIPTTVCIVVIMGFFCFAYSTVFYHPLGRAGKTE